MPTLRLCPRHKAPLIAARTRYGRRWACGVLGCSVVCWEGSTSTPADQETRNARKATHALFDPLWQNGKRFASRKAAYTWLREAMGLSKTDCHIGMFDLEQCGAAQASIRGLLEKAK